MIASLPFIQVIWRLSTTPPVSISIGPFDALKTQDELTGSIDCREFL